MDKSQLKVAVFYAFAHFPKKPWPPVSLIVAPQKKREGSYPREAGANDCGFAENENVLAVTWQACVHGNFDYNFPDRGRTRACLDSRDMHIPGEIYRISPCRHLNCAFRGIRGVFIEQNIPRGIQQIFIHLPSAVVAVVACPLWPSGS